MKYILTQTDANWKIFFSNSDRFVRTTFKQNFGCVVPAILIVILLMLFL